MSRKRFVFMVVLILALSLLALGAGGPAVMSAKGKGDYRELDPWSSIQETWIFEYSFSAKKYADNSVSGYAKERFVEESILGTTLVYDYEILVDCVNIFDSEYGTVVAVSGWITAGGDYRIITYIEAWDGDGFHNGSWHSSDPDTFNCMNPPSDINFLMPANLQIRIAK